HPEIDGGVEPHASLVGTQRGVELDPETPVDPDLAGVVDPRYSEDDLSLRLTDPLDDPVLQVLGVPHRDQVERLQHFVHRLVELRLARVAAKDPAVESLECR